MTLRNLSSLLVILLLSSCTREAGNDLAVEKAALVDELGSFRIAVDNRSSIQYDITQLTASCSCVQFHAPSITVPAFSVGHIVGFVDREVAPPTLGIRFLANGGPLSTALVVSGDEPEWDRGVVYRTDAAPGRDLGKVAAVRMNGTRDEVEARLARLRVSAPGIEAYAWSSPTEFSGRKDRWVAELEMVVAKDVGVGPITGWIELDGKRIRLVLAFESNAVK